MSPTPSLSHRSSLAERFSSAIPRPRLPSLRSRKSNISTSSFNGKTNGNYAPYAVYRQTMFPAILRDPDATAKLLEAILDSPSGRRSLSRLARTCKALKEPVLDLLWRDLESLAPLIALFPNTLLKRARRPGLGLVKNPEPDDWTTLLAYGERVRSITYAESVGNISPSIFPVFEDLRPRPWILPNLTSLTWKSETSAGLERCRLFLGPELQSIVLEVGTKHPKLNDLLVEVASHARLSSLSFTLHTNLPDNFTDTFQDNTGFQRLALTAPGALSSRVGKWASLLPVLQSLQLDLSGRTTTAVEGFFDEVGPGSGYSTPSSVGGSGGTDSGVFSADEFDFSEIRKSAVRLTQDGPRHGAFARLNQLQLTGEAANIAMFLRHLTSPLAQLELAIDDPPAVDDWQEVCALICERFASSLRALRIGATSASRFNELVRSTSRGGDTPIRHLPLTHFDALPHLQRFDIDLPESVLFHEADIAHLAHVFPSLEVLRLCPLARFPPITGPPSLTLGSLTSLTRQCRRLHTLGVVFNGLEGSKEMFSTRQVSSRSLLRLYVGHSWIKDPLQAAILISHLAPYLETLKWFNEKNRAGVVEANALAWQKVSEFLPPIQEVRLLERNLQEQPQLPPQPPQPAYVPPETAEKQVDATVIMVDRAMSARPELVDDSVQVEVEVVDFSVQASPELSSVSVDATPVVADEEVLVVPDIAERAVDARPETSEKAVDIMSVDIVAGPSEDHPRTEESKHMFPFLPSASGLMSLTVSVVRFYTTPIRFMFSFMPCFPKFSGSSAHVETESKSPVPGGQSQAANESGVEKPESRMTVETTSLDYISPDADHAYASMNTIISSAEIVGEEENSKATRESWTTGASTRDMHVGAGDSKKGKSEPDVSATRQSATPSLPLYLNVQLRIARPLPASPCIMAEPRKQEKDYTKEVDELLPETSALAQSGKLQDALDKLFVLEKQARNASDMASTTRLVKEILELSYAARDYATLNTSIVNLSKKHGQLKTAITAMVEQAMGWLEEILKREGTEKWLEVIETLRSVTEGKIFLETPRARVTLLLAHYHESLANSPTPTSPPPKESLQTASDLLSDLQVETYSSMERREKTEFILEQMRLLIAVARQKDAEIGQEGKKDSIGGGEAEWVKVRVGGRKVNEEFLKDAANEDLKLKFYDMMIQFALKHSAYLDAAKYFHKVWETPSIKEEEKGRGRQALEHIVFYIVLAPHDNEQSDMLHRIFEDPALKKLDLHYSLVKCFTTVEIMRWPGIEELYGPHLRDTSVFSDPKSWEDLHMRVIEHNIRIVAKYYTRITLSRLTNLLDLPAQQAEETLCRLVVSGTVWARIDRPSGIVNFRSAKSAEDVMNDWSSDMKQLLNLVEKTWMGVNAAHAAQARAVKA